MRSEFTTYKETDSDGKVRIELGYNRALTNEEIRELHRDPYQMFCAPGEKRGWLKRFLCWIGWTRRTADGLHNRGWRVWWQALLLGLVFGVACMSVAIAVDWWVAW